MSTPPDDVKLIFEKALECSDPTALAAYLDVACSGNPVLRAEIEGILVALERAGGFLNRGPVPDAATRTFGASSPETGSYAGKDGSIGAIIAGKYKLIEEIGEGGMGTVFLAQQTEPVKRLVAVKVIKSGMDSKAVLARFEAERQALAMMDHPHIARVLDAGGTEDGRPFFVMELVKGVPITRFCDDRKLTPRERLELFVPVCNAIQHAHQKGVIHRDIKPNNVLIAMYDDRPVPKVIDFGVAKATGSQLTDHTLVTGFGAVVGTPEYMSPEQASFNQMDVDTRSDVYALGVLLYELLTGTPPFSRKELEKIGLLEIFRVIREQEPARPSNKLSTASGLPSLAANRGTEPRRLTALVRGELDWIVMKALEKDRGRRYETANGFAADVQRYLAGEAVQAVPPSAWYRLKKTAQRNRGPVLAAFLVLFVLVGGIIGTTIGLFQAESAKQAESRERVRAEGERDEKEQARKETDEQRKRAEYQVASIGIDFDMEGNRDPKIELLRLARRLPTIPDYFPELKEFVIRRMLVLGQEIRSLLGQEIHSQTADSDSLWDHLSPDGQYVLRQFGGATALRETFTGRQIAIWRGPTRFVAEGRLILREGVAGQPVELWDTAGRRVMSTLPISDNRDAKVSSDGLRVLTTFYTPSNHDAARISGVQLWDGRSGMLVAELPITGYYSRNRTLFSPDGTTFLTAYDGLARVWSAADGRLIRELGRFPNRLIPPPVEGAVSRQVDGIADVSFSPTGRYIALFDGKAFHRWRVADGVVNVANLAQTNDIRQITNINIHWFEEELLGIVIFGGDYPEGSPIPFLLQGDVLQADVVRVKGSIALTTDRRLIDLASGRPMMVPFDKRYSPEISQFANDNRFLFDWSGVYDLKVSKHIIKNSKLTDDQIIAYFNHAWASVYPYKINLWSDWRTRTSHWWFSDEVRNRFAPFPAGALPPQESTILWANVVARGEIDRFGEFNPWDEGKWQEQRQSLARSIPPGEADIHFRPMIRDPLFWLRQEIEEASAPGPGSQGLWKDPGSLLDRLIAAEPTWENFTTRAIVRFTKQEYHLAIQDALEASRLAGVLIDPFNSQPSRSIGLERGKPRERYELALRWEEARRSAGIEDTSKTIALALYRLGRYVEALTLLDQEESKGIPGHIGRAVLTGSTGVSAPLHGLCAFTNSENRIPEPEIWHALRAMCHHKLDQPELAQRHLAAATAEQKIEDAKPNGLSGGTR